LCQNWLWYWHDITWFCLTLSYFWNIPSPCVQGVHMDRALNAYQFILETCDALRLGFTGVRLWHLHSLLNCFILSLLILGISQTWLYAAAHSGDSNLKVFWSTELTSYCDIFLQADQIFTFYDNEVLGMCCTLVAVIFIWLWTTCIKN